MQPVRKLLGYTLLPFAVAVITGALALMQPRTWESVVEFVPVASSQESRLERLAGTLGFSALSGAADQSPDFYVHLLGTEQFYRRLIQTCVTSASSPTCDRRVAELVSDRPLGSARDSAAAVRELRTRIASGAGQNSGVIQVRVQMAGALDAQLVGQRVLDWLNEFNGQQRASSARAERLFLEGRASETLRDLTAAEARLASFSLRNRDVRTSPQLQLEADRLEREVQLRQSTYTEVRGALEQSRLDEVRDTPLITVVQEPTLPLLPRSRQVVFWAIVGALLGAMLEFVRRPELRGSALSWIAGRRSARFASQEVGAGGG